MAETSFKTDDAMTGGYWSKSLYQAERENLDIQPLMGDDENSIIQVKTETRKGAGDKVTFGLRARLTGEGIGESEVAEGNGESLSIYSDAIVINELGHPVATRSANTIDQQRVPFDLRTQCIDSLGEWWATRKSVSFFNQVCGNTAQTNTKYTGLNATTAPTANRHLWSGSAGADEALTSDNIFTLDLIDAAVEMAKVGDSMVRPIRIDKQPKYVMYLHPYQVTSMRTNAATGQWQDIQKAAMMGGNTTRNPIYTGALGEYNGVILRSSQDVTLGCNSSTPTTAVANTRRAVLLGAQSAVVAYAASSGSGKMRMHEELFDAARRLEVSAWSIWGLKKTVFNSGPASAAVDFGTIVVSTYAAASA